MPLVGSPVAAIRGARLGCLATETRASPAGRRRPRGIAVNSSGRAWLVFTHRHAETSTVPAKLLMLRRPGAPSPLAHKRRVARRAATHRGEMGEPAVNEGRNTRIERHIVNIAELSEHDIVVVVGSGSRRRSTGSRDARGPCHRRGPVAAHAQRPASAGVVGWSSRAGPSWCTATPNTPASRAARSI